MTPDQWHQVLVELSGLAGAVMYGGHKRKKILDTQCEVEEGQVARIEAEGNLTRKELRETRDEMVRLAERIEHGEKSGDRLQSEMHALSGKVDAVSQKYTEILVAFKAREKPETVTGSVTFKEEKKKS